MGERSEGGSSERFFLGLAILCVYLLPCRLQYAFAWLFYVFSAFHGQEKILRAQNCFIIMSVHPLN